MKLMIDLFSTDYGLLSLGVIGITLLMMIVFAVQFFKRMENGG